MYSYNSQSLLSFNNIFVEIFLDIQSKSEDINYCEDDIENERILF